MKERHIFILFALIICFHITDAQNIIRYEYWFDNDYANKIIVPVQSGQSITITDNIDCSILTQGFHLCNIRFMQQQLWSNTLIKYFYKGPVVGNQQSIAGFEYWVESQDSLRNYVPNMPDSFVQFNNLLDFSLLPDGFHNLYFRIRNEAGQWSNTINKYFYKYQQPTIQNDIVAYEYWFDNDYLTKTTENVSSNPLLTLSTMIDCSSISNGVHVFNMRFKNAAGNWGNNRIYLFNNNASGSDITKYEYWFDNDYANKVVEPVQPGQSVNFSTLIDCSNLSQGFHFFNIRVKDQQHWSNSMIKYLFVGPVVEGQQFISGFEYWIDQDISQRIYVPITPDSLVQINDILDFAAISDGFHNLFLRVRNEAGQWSNVVHKHFYKYYNQSSQNNIIGYEYWFDSDYDNKTSVNILHIPTYSISTFVDCEHVDDGLHLFNVRFKNAAGSWSNSRIGFFYKNQEEAQNRILAYRYWIDDDYANSTLVNLTTQANPFYANMELLISPQSAGNHTFYIQYKDLNGWGNVVSQEFIYQANQLIGEVYDSYTGFPIVEALVQVQPQIDYGSGISDSNGEFVVIPVPTGIGYEIVVGANGYISKNIPSIDFYGGPNSDTVFVFLDPSIGAYSVVPLVPNPNSAISEIIEGGIGHRYYRVADNQDNSIANAEVSVNKQSGGTLSFHTDISGILDMEIGSTNVGSGSSSASELFEIVSVNAIPLQDTITFSCSIINKEYSKSWRNYTYTRGSISFVDVDNKRGAEVTVTGNGQSNNPPDELYLARQGRAYVGVTFGVSASAEIGMGEVVNHRFSQVLKLCIICS